MANIVPNDDVSVYKLQKFLGLNESPDGDTQLKMGEAAEMRNWQVTPQFHLRVRPGYKTVNRFKGQIRGMWSGYVAGERKTICAADGGVWDMTDTPIKRIGDIWDDDTTMFGFENKVYFLNGHEYLVWDGDGFVDTVEGYVPLTTTAIAPGGGGTPVENINRLTGRRRCKFSADGEAKEFQLPEKGLISVDKLVIGTEEAKLGWKADKTTGVITFEKVPEKGNSNIEVWYTMPNTLRSLVEGMRYAEQFNGAADTRVFLYGDGSAKAIYCGVTEDGSASAEYFPDLYEVRIGDDNAPLTAMIKYYDRLMSFKADGGAYSTAYEITTLADGSVVPGFKTVSTNKEIGNEAMGQVKLIKNVPRTIYSGNIYDWVFINYATRDERNAKMISQRVQETLQNADIRNIYCFDDDTNQEYYVFLNDSKGTALVHNYMVDVWYLYTGLPVKSAVKSGKRILFGFSDGRVVDFSDKHPNDDGTPIDAFFASGNMAFDREYNRKHSSAIWVSVKPTENANLIVTARSDRRGDYIDKVIHMGLSTFRAANFGMWSFMTNRAPKVERLKLKVKKFAYYQLVLKSNFPSSDATVLAVDFRVRYTGYVK